MLLVWDFSGVLVGFVGIGLGCLSPYQHFKDSILSDLCRRKGFRGGPLLDFRGSMQLLGSSHVRDRDKALLRAILSGGVWNGFLLQGAERKRSMSFFVGVRMGMVICFGSVLTPLWLLSERVLSFMTLSVWIRLVGA